MPIFSLPQINFWAKVGNLEGIESKLKLKAKLRAKGRKNGL